MGNYQILYVEDEAILGQLVQEALEDAGYEVWRVQSATAALNQYIQRRPHLALLDIMLPDMDGYDLAAKIRAEDKDLPIIFLTAKLQVSDVVTGYKAGCNDYIRKPFSTSELLLRIGLWLEERYGKKNNINSDRIALGNCDFLPAKGLLTVGAVTYKLTHKESEILRILYQYGQTGISRNHLQQQVWGIDSIYTSRILDVYMSKLRKYLSGSGNEIVTLKGIGYRFIRSD